MTTSTRTLEAPADSWSVTFMDLLRRQQALVQRLAELARAQTTLIAERHTDQLLELLAQRQSIIDDFTASQRELAAMTSGLEAHLAEIASSDRQEISHLIRAIGDCLAEIMQRDQEDQASLSVGRDSVRAQIHALGATRAAHNAYAGGPAASGSRFSDQQG
jgi:hypothetical protein